MKWTEKPSLYLGIKIAYDLNSQLCSISQTHYIKTVLDRFKLTNCNAVKTPLPVKTFLRSGTETEIAAAKDLPYQQLVGCLRWIASSTRPDIAHAVSQLSPFKEGWTDHHWTLAKHFLRYLKGKKKLSIQYSPDSISPNTLVTYSHADFSQCPETSQSVTGYLIRMNGGTVIWNRCRQPVVALSTTKSEYMAAADAARHLAWVKSFLFDIFIPVDEPIQFNNDNRYAISITTKEVVGSKSRHINRLQQSSRSTTGRARLMCSMPLRRTCWQIFLPNHLAESCSKKPLGTTVCNQMLNYQAFFLFIPLYTFPFLNFILTHFVCLGMGGC